MRAACRRCRSPRGSAGAENRARSPARGRRRAAPATPPGPVLSIVRRTRSETPPCSPPRARAPAARADRSLRAPDKSDPSDTGAPRIAGGRLRRHIRAQRSRLDERELSARQRAVLELVILQKRTHRQAAEQLGIRRSTIFKDLTAIARRLDDGAS